MPLSQDDRKQYKALYLQTAGEYIEELRKNLEQVSSGQETEEIVATLHRAAHSLTSQSMMMGYQHMGDLASVMEKIFQAKKGKTLELSQELLSVLSAAVASMHISLEAINKSDTENDLTPEKEKLQSLAKLSA